MYPWPTRVGRAVIFAALFTKVFAEHRLLSVGALIALGLVMVLEVLVNFWVLSQRPVTLAIVKTVVVSPERFQFTAEAPRGFGHVQLVLRRLSITNIDSEFVTLKSDETARPVVMSDGGTLNVDHVRFRTAVSMLGLIEARRWTTQVMPRLHRLPAPVEETVELASVDDLGRLRSYVPGDRMANVSWGTSARTGTLHVRAPANDLDEVTLVVDVGQMFDFDDGVSAVDHVTARALSIGRDLLKSGRVLRIVSNTPLSPIIDDSRRQALARPRNPRLKGATFSDDGNHTFQGAPLTEVSSDMVYNEDGLIRRLTRVEIGPPLPAPRGPHITVRKNDTSVTRT